MLLTSCALQPLLAQPCTRRRSPAPHRVRAAASGDVWTEELRGRAGETDEASTREQAGAEAQQRPRSVRDVLEAFFLPPGYSRQATLSAVSPDYLRYALLNYPVHGAPDVHLPSHAPLTPPSCAVTGWLSHSLATAALLRAVGVGSALAAAAPAAVPALTGASKWVLKDGLGAFGRLVVAGRVAGLLDSAPRQWRLYAELASVAGGVLEVSTVLAPPDAFLALAAGGTALRAAASAIAKPAHTVVLAHLATPGVSSLGTRRAANLGSVSAKEEVQEVAANLSGLLISLVSLQLLGGGEEAAPQTLAAAWAVAASSHFALRYAALSGLVFRSLNARRAVVAAQAHVSRCCRDAEGSLAGTPWASFSALNAAEPCIIPFWAMRERVRLGAGLGEALAAAPEEVRRTLQLSLGAQGAASESERFRVAWRRNLNGAGGDVWCFFLEGATPRDVLRAAWLGTYLLSCAGGEGERDSVERGAAELRRFYPQFEAALRAENWDVSPLRDLPRCRIHSLAELQAGVAEGVAEAAAGR